MRSFARADAHVHLFEGSYQGNSFTRRPGVLIDEVLCYQSLMQEHQIQAALVIGFAGESWCAENNGFLAELIPRCSWMQALAYWDLNSDRDPLEQLEEWRGQGFIGISLYVFEKLEIQGLAGIKDEVWNWLECNGWLISVNSSGGRWSLWKPILEKHPRLRLAASHLGLPSKFSRTPSRDEAFKMMSPLNELYEFPEVHVKLSGYYALTDPAHDFPHEAAWPVTEVILKHFGSERLLWGSDFSPCLDFLSFPQTYGLFSKMPFFNEEDRKKILGGNLLRLIGGEA